MSIFKRKKSEQQKANEMVVKAAYQAAVTKRNKELKGVALEKFTELVEIRESELADINASLKPIYDKYKSVNDKKTATLNQIKNDQEELNNRFRSDGPVKEVAGTFYRTIREAKTEWVTDAAGGEFERKVTPLEWEEVEYIIGDEMAYNDWKKNRTWYVDRKDRHLEMMMGRKNPKYDESVGPQPGNVKYDVVPFDLQLTRIQRMIDIKEKSSTTKSEHLTELRAMEGELRAMQNDYTTDQINEIIETEHNSPLQHRSSLIPKKAQSKTLNDATKGTWDGKDVMKNSAGSWYYNDGSGGQPLVPKAKLGEIKDLSMIGSDPGKNQQMVQGAIKPRLNPKQQNMNPAGKNMNNNLLMAQAKKMFT